MNHVTQNTHALIYGTIAIDTLIAPSGTADAVLGGSGVFAALAARLITDKAHLIGVVGTDFPPSYRAQLEEKQVSMQHVDTLEGRSFAWTGRYEDDINIRETVETIIGVQEEWQLCLPAPLQHPAVAVVCNSSPELQMRMIDECRSARFIMLDTMKLWLTLDRSAVCQLLSRVDLALMNEEEAEFFAGTSDVIASARAILAEGPRYAIVKLGSKGSVLVYKDAESIEHVIECPAWELDNALDPTGAGDCFLGALAAYFCEYLIDVDHPQEEQLLTAMHHAATVAARVCEGMGTTSIMEFSTEEMRERVKRFTQI